MRVLLTVLLILLYGVTASAQTGVYTVSGVNPDGKPYVGIAEISTQHGVLVVEWELEAGDTAEGYLYLDGDMLVYIGRAVSPDQSRQAFVFGHYRLKDGKWMGKWSSPGQPSPGTETLTPSTKTRDQLRQTLKAPKAQV